MNIFVRIKNSIYNPEYYSEATKKPFSHSFKYLLIFGLLFAFVFAIVVIIKFVPIVNLLSDKAPQMADYFPEGLVVTIKDGKVSTNVQEPYFIKIPQELKDNSAHLESADITLNGNSVQLNTNSLDNLVVINTKDKFDIGTFYSYKTLILLTSDSIAYLDKNNQISIGPLSDVKDFTLDRGKILSFIDIIKPFLIILYPLVFVGAYIIGYIAVIIKMIYLLFGALLIWIVVKIKGIKMGYKESYKVGMQLMTAAIIITSVLGAISEKLTFAFLFSILLIISATLNLKVEKIELN